MRIFQVIEASAHHAIPLNQTWYRNLYEPLVEMGHDVVLFSANDAKRAMRYRDKQAYAIFSQKLLDTFCRENAIHQFDLFFSYLIDGMVDPNVIEEIRKLGIPTCNFSCNNTHQFHLVTGLSTHFDYNLHSERDVAHKFIKIGANPLWWPMASNPKYFRPYDLPRDIPVSFVGGNYALRARYLYYLLENGVDVHAYGPAWRFGARTPFRSLVKRYLLLMRTLFSLNPAEQVSASAMLSEHDFNRRLSTRFPNYLHMPVSDEELIWLYSRSQISLGFLEVYDKHDPSRNVARHVHLREFEAPMSGALYFTGYLDELSEFYELDKEIVVYRSEQELLDKILYYLSHPYQAETIRKAGYQRALSEHTYHRRFQQLFSQLGILK